MALTDDKIEDMLLDAGIKNLNDFGYTDVNKETIITDMVYSAFFKKMLQENKGQSTDQIDNVIDGLLLKIVNL